jgi:hypothetical protein
MPPTTGLPSARRKLQRAQQHLDEFKAEVSAFEASEALSYKVEWKPEDESATEVACSYIFTRADEAPEILSTIIGDVLTNLRAALDHSVFDHAKTQLSAEKGRDLTSEEEARISFPIAKKQSSLKACRNNFTPVVYQYIETLHDFTLGWQSPVSTVSHLDLLRRFVNVDKHRAIVPSNFADLHVDGTVQINYIRPIDSRHEYSHGTAEVGREFLKIWFEKVVPLEGISREDLISDISIRFPVILEVPDEPSARRLHTNPTTRRPSAVEMLQGMYDAVGEVLDELQRLGV